MNKKLKIILISLGSILLIWTALTFWAQWSGSKQVENFGAFDAQKSALIVYNPDPIYNLDEQVCKAFAKGLAENEYEVKIITSDAKVDFELDHDLYVFCANTYNWAPDWGITSFIGNAVDLSNRNVFAITLGSGSTSRSKKLLEQAILEKYANLIESKELWLLRPNDESRLDDDNVDVAIEKAYHWAIETNNNLFNKKQNP